MTIWKRLVLLFAAVGFSSAAPAAEPQIVADAHAAAEWVAKALSSSGYKADFSTESLAEVDRFFDEQAADGKPVAGGLLSEDLGARLFGIGSYVGETLRRKHGGTWVGDDRDRQAEINLELRLPDGTRLWPIQRVMKRLQNGREDGLDAYGAAMSKPE